MVRIAPQVIQIGDSLGITIPARIVRGMKIKKGDVLEIDVIGKAVFDSDKSGLKS